MTKNFKAGPWSAKDKQFISDQAGILKPEEIAEKLGRNVNAVRKYMTKQGLTKYYYKKELEKDELENVRKSRYWQELQHELTPAEMETFEYHWKNIIKQFRDDIFHTEELQIVDAIKLEIKMERCLRREKEVNDKIDLLRKELAAEQKKKTPNNDILDRLGREIAGYYSIMGTFNEDYLKLQRHKNEALSKLKATREQRIQQIESSKETLPGWIKSLYNNPKLRYELGMYMEKMRIATKAEYEKLSQYHTYQDKMVDRPILNHETVLRCEDTEETEQIPDTKKQDKNA